MIQSEPPWPHPQGNPWGCEAVRSEERQAEQEYGCAGEGVRVRGVAVSCEGEVRAVEQPLVGWVAERHRDGRRWEAEDTGEGVRGWRVEGTGEGVRGWEVEDILGDERAEGTDEGAEGEEGTAGAARRWRRVEGMWRIPASPAVAARNQTPGGCSQHPTLPAVAMATVPPMPQRLHCQPTPLPGATVGWRQSPSQPAAPPTLHQSSAAPPTAVLRCLTGQSHWGEQLLWKCRWLQRCCTRSELCCQQQPLQGHLSQEVEVQWGGGVERCVRERGREEEEEAVGQVVAAAAAVPRGSSCLLSGKQCCSSGLLDSSHCMQGRPAHSQRCS